MFKPIQHAGKLLGYGLQHKHVFFFFGSRHLAKDDLWSLYPEYEYTFLKQVHGKTVLEASPETEAEADAQFTRRVTRAPVVQTADCVPILLASKNQVCAIHSGWRGVAQNITGAARTCFAGEKVLFAAIGPHILSRSFEVGHDVAAQLMAASPYPDKAQSYLRPQASSDKTHFDLTQLVRDQLTAAFGAIEVFECLHDTKTSADFHSFRRDQKQAGRQYSFVVINA